MQFKNKSIEVILIFLFSGLIFPQVSKSNVIHPEWSYNKTIYEVNLRQFSKSGTLNEFDKYLPSLKEMGVGIIWFMPLHPIGVKNRKGTLGSYYSVKDYLAIDASYGTKEDFKNTVNTIHKMGMYVIIDWVANHTAWDNKLAVEHPEWYSHDKDGNFLPPVTDWHDVIDLDYSNAELRKYMINAMKYWITEYDIDGFRCDVAGMVPTDFWNEARKQLDAVKPVFMLAEAEDPELHKEAFDMTYSWELFNLMNDIAARKKNAKQIINYFSKEQNKFPTDAFRMRFTSNHDENTWNGTVYERLGNAAETFAAFTVAIPGMPLIYNGQEAGLNKRLKFFEKDPIEWKNSNLKTFYAKLFNLKLNNKALLNGNRGGAIYFIDTNSDDVIAFTREKDGNKIIAVFNFSGNDTVVNLSSEFINGNYINLFDGTNIKLKEKISLNLKAWVYKLFTSQ